MMKRLYSYLIILVLLVALPSCASSQSTPTQGAMKILVVESFLGDIVQQVAGEQSKIDVLIPLNLDPHAFEPTPQDIARISEADILVINGSGLEGWLEKTLANVSETTIIIEASKGLTPRTPGSNEVVDAAHPEGDPHFWLDPNFAIKYVENIRDGLAAADPANKDAYAQNSKAYIDELILLDSWIAGQVSTIPIEKRLLVTNHESFGYFADRYGFKVIGAIIPSVSTNASPSAQQLAALITQIRESGAPAIFLETGANPQLADQIASETGVKVIMDLYTHSLTDANGDAPSYIDMMRHNTELIVSALK